MFILQSLSRPHCLHGGEPSIRRQKHNPAVTASRSAAVISTCPSAKLEENHIPNPPHNWLFRPDSPLLTPTRLIGGLTEEADNENQVAYLTLATQIDETPLFGPP